MDPEDFSNNEVTQMKSTDLSIDGVDGMDSEDVLDDEVAHIGSKGITDSEVAHTKTIETRNDQAAHVSPKDASSDEVAHKKTKDAPIDEATHMSPKDASNNEVAHKDANKIPTSQVDDMDSGNIPNSDSEAALAVVVPLRRNELARATESIQPGGGPATTAKGLSAKTIVGDDDTTEATPLCPNEPRHVRSVQPDGLDTFEPVNRMSENAAPASHSPTRTPKLKKKQRRHRIEIRKASKSRNTSREPTKAQDGMEDAQTISATGPQESGVGNLHRRRPASKTRVSEGLATPRNPIAQPQDESLLSDIANDLRGLSKAGFQAAPRLSRSLYRRVKWLPVVYVIWLIITYLCVSMQRLAITVLVPICVVPILGPRIPFCPEILTLHDRPINASKVTTAQEELTLVMERVGQNCHLSRDIWDYVKAVGHLKIHVELSHLNVKGELIQELERLLGSMTKAARYLSRFTAKAGSTIRMIQYADSNAVKALKRIAERQRVPPRLLDLVLLMIGPFAAFGPANPGFEGEQVKQIFIRATDRILDEVHILIKASEELDQHFAEIADILKRVYLLAMREIGGLPRMSIFGELWASLANIDGYKRLISHQSLLTDIIQHYGNSSLLVHDAVKALDRMNAELREFSNDLTKSQFMLLKHEPLESIIAQFSEAGRQLEREERELERVKGGGRPQKPVEFRTAVTKEATLIKTAAWT